MSVPDLHIKASRCPHGMWHSHNALRLPDGTVIDDPEGACAGGMVESEAGDQFLIPIALASFLDLLDSRYWTKEKA